MASFNVVQFGVAVNSSDCNFSTLTTPGNVILAIWAAFGNGPGFSPAAPGIPTLVTDDSSPSDTFDLYGRNYQSSQTSIACYAALNIKGGSSTVSFSGYTFAQSGSPSMIIMELEPTTDYTAYGVNGSDDITISGGGVDQRKNGSSVSLLFGSGKSASLNRVGLSTLEMDSGEAEGSNTIVSFQLITSSDVTIFMGDYAEQGGGAHSWTSSTGPIVAFTSESGGGSAAVTYAVFPYLSGPGCSGGSSLTLSCNNPPAGTVGVPYSHALSASGGTPPYTFALISGSLPTGLSLDTSTGIISGTPSANGTFTFGIEVTDSVSATADVSCSISIGAPPLTITCGVAPPLEIGVPWSETFPVTGGSPPYTFAKIGGTFPPGLTLNSTTGVLSGTPTAVGSYSFTIQVTDSVSATASVTCSVVSGARNPMRLTYCDDSLYFDYTDILGNAVCLRYEIYKKRWFPHFYNGDAIVTHYLAEPSVTDPNTMDLLMPSRTQGLIYIAGGDTDNGNDINTFVQTASMDGGDERGQKLYVDMMLDADGVGTLTVGATFDNAQGGSTPPLIVNPTGPRTQYLLNISSLSNLSLYRNIAATFSWTGGPDGVRLYAWEPSGFLQPYLSSFFVTQFIPFSFPGWKHMRRMYPALISNASVLMTIKTQDGRTYGPYTIASTGGLYRILPQMLDAGIKDLAFALQLDGQGSTFAFFPNDFHIEAKEWSEESYVKIAVFKS